MEKNYDIDTEEELRRAEMYLKIISGKHRFVFDIDGVIAKIQKDNNYSCAEPNTEMISLINKLYQMGNEIILYTARGYVTGIDWRDVTVNQLKNWGLCYHELHFGKPNSDFYIDDKMIGMDQLMDILI